MVRDISLFLSFLQEATDGKYSEQPAYLGSVPALPPKVTSATPLSGTYLLSLVDPDASVPAAPTVAQYLHWLQPGLIFSSTPNSTAFPANIPSAAAVAYARPAPPPTSSAHRYITLLYAQPSNFSIPATFQGFSASNRTKFNISVFAAETGLGAPIAANYFLVSNMTVANATNSTATSPSIPTFTGGTARTTLSIWIVATGVIGGWALVL